MEDDDDDGGRMCCEVRTKETKCTRKTRKIKILPIKLSLHRIVRKKCIEFLYNVKLEKVFLKIDAIKREISKEVSQYITSDNFVTT